MSGGGMAAWTGDEAVGAAPKPDPVVDDDGPVLCGCGHRVVAHWRTDPVPAREGFGACELCDCTALHLPDGTVLDLEDPLTPTELHRALTNAGLTAFERRLLATLRRLTDPRVTIYTLIAYRRAR